MLGFSFPVVGIIVEGVLIGRLTFTLDDQIDPRPVDGEMLSIVATLGHMPIGIQPAIGGE